MQSFVASQLTPPTIARLFCHCPRHWRTILLTHFLPTRFATCLDIEMLKRTAESNAAAALSTAMCVGNKCCIQMKAKPMNSSQRQPLLLGNVLQAERGLFQVLSCHPHIMLCGLCNSSST